MHHDDEVIRVTDELPVTQPLSAPLVAAVAIRFPLGRDMLVQYRPAILASSGERTPPCGVPVMVSSRSPDWFMTLDFRNDFTSELVRLSLIRPLRRSINAV